MKAAFITYFRRATEYVKTNLLNMPATEREPASAQAAAAAPQGYMQSLLARFSVPTTHWGSGAANTGNEFYNLLANAVSAVTTSATTGSGGLTNNISSSGSSSSSSGNNNKRGNKGVSDSGVLIPPHLRGSAEKMSFIAAQRERLNILLRALDQEAQQIQRDGSRTTTTTTTRPGAFATDSGSIGDGNSSSEDDAAAARTSPSGLTALSKSRSETEFEKVEAESGAEDEGQLRRRYASSGSGGSWRAWAWGPGDAAAAGAHPGPKQD